MNYFENMRRDNQNTINNAYLSIINESKWNLNDLKMITRSYPTVIQIKEALIKLSGASDWRAFINSQKVGDCSFIAKSVAKMFPKMKMYSVIVNFSEQAISQMEPQTDPNMFTCTHFLNRCKDQYFDFGKGTNRYEGVYVLDGLDDMYSCIYSSDAVEHIVDPIEVDPKTPGVLIR